MISKQNEAEQQMNENDFQLPIHEKLHKDVNKEELKQIILRFQNEQQKGYYLFSDWGKLHEELFALVAQNLPQTVLNLWRVLKLINFGDDFIPTGLIYDTLVTLMMMATEQKTELEKNKVNEDVEVILKTIFFKFIQFNGKYLTQKQKEELAFFKVIKPVTEGYRKIISSHFQEDQSLQGSNVQKGIISKGMSRNQQLYKMYDVFVYKKNLQKLKKIEEQFKQCTFEPDLSYTSRSNFIAESRYMQTPKKKPPPNFATSHLIESPNYIIPEEEDEEQRLFRANPIPVYPQVSPQGINEHLERMQRSRQIRRINSLKYYPSLSSTITKTVKEFTIDQRDQERRKRMLSSYKILFIIKVQVGKRIYSVKVRQNMNVADVVRAIQMMVGFKHPEVEEIVKGYFINWEMKIKENPQVSIQDQYGYK